MTTRKLTCLNDNAQFTEQEAARLCVRCQEPYRPQAGQISRCSSCGAEGINGKLSCECVDGRLEDSGYRCPGCGLEGRAEMLDGPLACPYCLNAVERPEGPRPKSVHQTRRVGVRRLGQVAALGLCVVGTLAAAYELAPQVIERWDNLKKIFPAKHEAAKNTQPTVQNPPLTNRHPLECRSLSNRRKRSLIRGFRRFKIRRLRQRNCNRLSPKPRQSRPRKSPNRVSLQEGPAISRRQR